jgi:asparagine synthase (glutamine-hydrolysing)
MHVRGPDAEGLVALHGGHTILGHRRLSIIDLDSRSDQPMVTLDGRYAIVFNGEIYNFKELRRELEAKGEHFRTTSDTEVLLVLFRRDGAAMLPRLRGMFAFAISDEAEGSLFLARDPYGIKPLYYAKVASGFAFASQVKALLASGLVSTEREPAGLAGFYLWGSVPEPWTLYRDIRALPAGHWMAVRGGSPGDSVCWHDIRQHWRGDTRAHSPDVLQEFVRATVTDSVRAHLVADVPVSVFLSGGIDSSVIAGLAAQLGSHVEGITIGFEEFAGQRDDEVPVARAIAEHYGLPHHVRMVSQQEFKDDLPRILDAMDQPSIDGVNTWFASKAAAECGYKVVLSGVGGDELFYGYPSFRQIPRLFAAGWATAVPGARPVLRAVSRAVVQLSHRPKLAGIAEMISDLESIYFLRRGLFLPRELPDLLGVKVAHEGLQKLGFPLPGGIPVRARDPCAGVGALESTQYLRNQLLRDSDWASMAHSLELRTPLVDTALLSELGPVLRGFEGGRGKVLLSRAPMKPLPQSIVTRRKTGFGLPMGIWLKEALPALAPTRRKMSQGSSPGTASRQWGVAVARTFRTTAEDESRKGGGKGPSQYAQVARSTAPTISIVQFQRKPFPSSHSIERIFEDVRAALRDRLTVNLRINANASKGVFPRLRDALSAAGDQGDVNHVTGDVHYLTFFLNRKRSILTVLDCISLERSRGLIRLFFWFFWYRLPLSRVRYVTVISEFTKQALLRYVNFPSAQILIIPPPVSEEFVFSPKNLDLNQPRILQVGTGINKNLPRVIQALQSISCRLVIVGPIPNDLERALNHSGTIWESHVALSRNALLAQYQLADIVVFVSTYEGFGMPIVEANAVGRPVITSNVCSMPEVAGDAAALVDPFDVASIRSAIEQLISDRSYCDRLVAAGRRNAERFRVGTIAAQYEDLYRRVDAEALLTDRPFPANQRKGATRS